MSEPARITPYINGPFIVRGDVELTDSDGNPIETGRSTFALCRCGRSKVRPFCDGTHKTVNFRAGTGREQYPPSKPSDPPDGA